MYNIIKTNIVMIYNIINTKKSKIYRVFPKTMMKCKQGDKVFIASFGVMN